MLIEKLRDRDSKPDPACGRSGYWVAGAGIILTMSLGFGSFAFPPDSRIYSLEDSTLPHSHRTGSRRR